jgi:spore coat protein U-like protein
MKRLAPFLAALALAWAPQPARALLCHPLLGCSCSVSAPPLDFDALSPFDGAQSAEGQVTIDCTGLIELAPAIVVRMQSGVHGTIAARKMQTAAGDQLNYNIYTTSQHTTIWGNGATGSTVTVPGGLLSAGHWTVNRAVYGIVAPTPATKPGDYSDTVIVRIDW